MTEAARTIALAAAVLGGMFCWLSIRTARISSSSPDRLVAELRLAQLAAALLIFCAAAPVGLAAANETRPGVGLDVALSVGFFVLAATVTVRDPREALTFLALGFGAHALVDILHRPGLLPPEIAPRWYFVGCAVYDVCIGALCYLPIMRR